MCFFCQRGDLAVDGFEFRNLSEFLFQDPLSKLKNWAARFPLLNLISRAVSEVAHAFGVRAGAVSFAFEQRRATASAGALNGFAGGLVDCEHIVAIDFEAGQAIRRATLSDTRIARGVLERHFRRELIVLAYEQHGQFPDARQVEAFVKRAVIHRAIAEERDRDVIRFHQLETVARARRLKNARPDDAAGSHQTDLWREQMHGAASTAGATRLATVKLGEKLARIESLGQRMAMSAMRAEDHVVLPKMRANADRNGLLPDVSVTRAVDESALMRLGQPLFAKAD